jgi:hypothetical protein
MVRKLRPKDTETCTVHFKKWSKMKWSSGSYLIRNMFWTIDAGKLGDRVNNLDRLKSLASCCAKRFFAWFKIKMSWTKLVIERLRTR